MMSHFTKEARQSIVREFALRHNGQYNPGLFLEEVQTTGPSHAAYGWFEWDAGKAALNYQIQQARDFARDLRVSFKVEEIGGKAGMRVKQSAMPLVISPTAGRKTGGGYLLFNPDDNSHLVEHCHQAAVTLKSWLNRYEAAVIRVGGSSGAVLDLVHLLEAVAPALLEAAE